MAKLIITRHGREKRRAQKTRSDGVMHRPFNTLPQTSRRSCRDSGRGRLHVCHMSVAPATWLQARKTFNRRLKPSQGGVSTVTCISHVFTSLNRNTCSHERQRLASSCLHFFSSFFFPFQRSVARLWFYCSFAEATGADYYWVITRQDDEG